MTTPAEAKYTIKEKVPKFLRWLIQVKRSDLTMTDLRQRAISCLHHYPFRFDIDRRWSDDVCEHENDRVFCRECGLENEGISNEVCKTLHTYSQVCMFPHKGTCPHRQQGERTGECTTHHYACDCREEKFRKLEALILKIKESGRLTGYQVQELDKIINGGK